MATTNDILLNLINNAVEDKLASLFVHFEERIVKLVDSAVNSNSDNSNTLDLIQVAEFLQLPPATIYKYTSEKIIPHIKIGKHLSFDKQEIIEWRKGFAVKTKSELEKHALKNITNIKKR